MTKFKGREKKILDRMLEIDDEHASILVVKYKSLNLDTMLFELEKVPDQYKKLAIEYNELKHELMEFEKKREGLIC